MVDTAFDRAERGLGSTDLSVADIVAKTRGNPNEIMKLVMAGQINLTQGLLAKRLSDSVVAEQQKAAAPTTTVLQDSFPQLAPAMGGLQSPAAPMAPPAPQGMGPVAPQMAEGGLAQLDFAAPDYAGGGIVAFAEGDEIDLERFRRAIIAQESGGDYGITNREGSGAMGAYQFMPATARALAQRLGLDYRPELLSGRGGRSEEGRRYQDALGTAALQEAIQFSGGDLNRAAAYHFAGPNERRWGDRTARYQRQLAARYGGEGDENTRSATTAASTAAPSSARNYLLGNIGQLTATPNIDVGSFLSQLPEQSREALQRYRERVERQEDPEKERERAELGALFQAIGGVRPGMNPLEALAQGFAGTGASMQAAEERARTRELEQLRTAADLERMENQMGRENFQLAFDMARVQAGLADSATARRVAILTAAMDDETKRALEQASIELRRTLGERELRLTERQQNLDYAEAAYKAENPSASDTSFVDQAIASRLGMLGGIVPGTAGLSMQSFSTTAPRTPFPSLEDAAAGRYTPGAAPTPTVSGW